MTTPQRSREQLDARFEQWRASGDRRVRNALVEDYAWLASYCAHRFANRGESRDDLGQVAFLGLVNAVDRFDPSRGLAFSTFAVPTILGELRRHFRDKTWSVHVTRRAKEASRTVAIAADELTAALGRTPSIPEIAERASLGVDHVLEALEVNVLRRGASFDPFAGDSGEDTALGVDDTGFASAEARNVVATLLAVLPTDRDRRIVRMRFVEGLTQSEIAQRIGVSQVQVSRLLRANLDRMRRAADRGRAGRRSTPAGSEAGQGR